MNPSSKWCYVTCKACTRCDAKGTYAKCNSCSGRHDPQGKWDPYDIDDKCRCTEGILQIRLQNGKLIGTKYPGDPFGGTVTTEQRSADEEDWNSYLKDQREILNDEHWDPVQFTDGSSTFDWVKRNREGRA